MSAGEEEVYLSCVQNILKGYPSNLPIGRPTQILPYVYLGSQRDARDISRLNQLGISHIVNCALWPNKTFYNETSGIQGYLQLRALDSEGYDILQHFDEVKEFIDEAKQNGGKVLIHCAMGINRSGALCLAYVMVSQRTDLLETVRLVKENRLILLANRGFQRQLIRFARKHKLLPHIGDGERVCN